MGNNAGFAPPASIRLAGTILRPDMLKNGNGSDAGLSKAIPSDSFPVNASTAQPSCIVWLTAFWNKYLQLPTLVWPNASILSWTVRSCIARGALLLWWMLTCTRLWPVNTPSRRVRYPSLRTSLSELLSKDCVHIVLRWMEIPKSLLYFAISGLILSSNDALCTFSDKGWPGAGLTPRQTMPESWGRSFFK